MKKLTKSLALILTLAMTLSTVPAITTNAAPQKAKNKVVYELKEGTLTVSGKGKMPDSMRFKNNKKIKKVVIKKGVTYISKYAFSGCKNLKSVKISNTVKEIGWHSFEGTKIEKITIPSSVKTIGNYAFVNCNKLTTITMPGDFKIKVREGEDGRESSIIMSGENIKTVNFNTDLNVDKDIFFEGTELNVRKKDSKYKSINGVIYTKDGKEIVRVPSRMKELKVAEGCEVFNLESICYTGYYYDEDEGTACCGELEKVILPASIKKIRVDADSDVIYDAYGMSLKDIEINTKQLDAESITTLLRNVRIIAECNEYGIAPDDIVEEMPDRIKVVDDALYIVDNEVVAALTFRKTKKTITIPEGVKKIADYAFTHTYSYFYDEAIEKVIIPEGVEEIGDCAFEYLFALKEVNLPDSLRVIGDRAFASTNLDKVNISKNIIKCGDYAFEGSAVKEAILPDEMTVIPNGLFSHCYNLENVNVPKNLKKIGKEAFASTLVDVAAFLENKNLTTVGKKAFENTKWKELTIPKNIKKVGREAFTPKGKKAKITVEGKTKNFNKAAFEDYTPFVKTHKVTVAFESGVKNSFTNVYTELNSTSKKNVKEVCVTWTKVSDIDGYDIRISTNKKFKKNVIKVNAGKNKKSKKVKLTTKKKKVYVKIRPYKKVNGKKVYGRWTMDNSNYF